MTQTKAQLIDGKSAEIEFSGGSASAPAISFTGDTNTGIYSPGADQLALSTNGVQRINIEADGDINIDSGGVFYDATNNRLAIGTTSPSQLLHIQSADTARIQLTAATNNTSRIHFGDTDSATIGQFIYDHGNDSLQIVVNSGEKARIDSSGRLLVGTSSSFGGGYGAANLQVSGPLNGDPAEISLRRNYAGLNSSGMGAITFYSPEGQIAQITANTNGTQTAGTSSPGALVFSTTADGASSPTTRYTITSTGSFVYGQPTVGLFNAPFVGYNGNSNAVIGEFGAGNNTAVNNGAVYNIELRMSGNASGQFLYANYITSGGSRTLGAYCTGTTWTNSSDIANKEEINVINYGLDTVLAMRPVNFRWKSQRDADGNGKPDVGFIAQEMETLVPEVVTGQEGCKGISYGNLVAVLTKAIQEQQTMIAELQAKVAALEAQ